MNILYMWNRIVKKLNGKAIQNSYFEKPSRVGAGSTVINTRMGRYSYCGYDCMMINSIIGRYCSISNDVKIGLASHPISWVSTSPAFYKGGQNIKKDLAVLEYNSSKETTIGNDVWIGNGSWIKDGVTIGTGSIIGMGSVVTKDVQPYSIVGGNPAKLIRYRFTEGEIQRLLESKWWELESKELKEITNLMSNPHLFLSEIEKIKNNE